MEFRVYISHFAILSFLESLSLYFGILVCLLHATEYKNKAILTFYLGNQSLHLTILTFLFTSCNSFFVSSMEKKDNCDFLIWQFWCFFSKLQVNIFLFFQNWDKKVQTVRYELIYVTFFWDKLCGKLWKAVFDKVWYLESCVCVCLGCKKVCYNYSQLSTSF